MCDTSATRLSILPQMAQITKEAIILRRQKIIIDNPLFRFNKNPPRSDGLSEKTLEGSPVLMTQNCGYPKRMGFDSPCETISSIWC